MRVAHLTVVSFTGSASNTSHSESVDKEARSCFHVNSPRTIRRASIAPFARKTLRLSPRGYVTFVCILARSRTSATSALSVFRSKGSGADISSLMGSVSQRSVLSRTKERESRPMLLVRAPKFLDTLWFELPRNSIGRPERPWQSRIRLDLLRCPNFRIS
jgi:hypothetical protein